MEHSYLNVFDSHSHYDSEQFDDDRDSLLDELFRSGAAGIMAAADTLESAARGREMAQKYDRLWCSVGIHPHEAKSAPNDLESRLEGFFAYEKCLAVGEIGLDYHYDFSPREIQLEVFERQLAFAKKHDLPVIVHDREAHAEVYALLAKYNPRGVVHCYSGSAESAAELVKIGMYIGFTGAITFKGARRALEAIAAIPADRLLLETDCPYMAPVPNRGKRCDSSMIPLAAAVMASCKGMETQDIIDITCKNTCDLFGISF